MESATTLKPRTMKLRAILLSTLITDTNIKYLFKRSTYMFKFETKP